MLQNVYNAITAIYFRILLIGDTVSEKVQIIVGRFLVALTATLVLLLIALICKWELLAHLAAVMASLLFLLSWQAIRITGNLIESAFPSTKMSGAKKIFFPLMSFSLLMAFIAFYVNVKGLNEVTWAGLGLVSSIGFFLTILTVYLQMDKKWLGWVLATVVCGMLIGRFFPDKVYGYLHFIDSLNTRIQSSLGRRSMDLHADSQATYGYALQDAELYTINLKPAGTRVVKGERLLISDASSKIQATEPMVFVTVANGDGDYINSSQYLLPRRKVQQELAVTSNINTSHIGIDRNGIFTPHLSLFAVEEEKIQVFQQSERTFEVMFLTDDPTLVLKTWPRGVVITFSTFNDKEKVYHMNPTLAEIPLGFPLNKTINTPLVMKYKNGGKLLLTF